MTQQPIVILRKLKSRETSTQALTSNLSATSNVSSLLRSTLGPNAMMKMVINKMGTQITNDGNSILRDVDFPHPAARFLVELSRTQEQAAGDGTTSVILLSAEMFSRCVPLVTERGLHPNDVIRGLQTFLSIALENSGRLATPFDFFRPGKVVERVIQTTLNSKTVLSNERLLLDLVYASLERVLFSPSNKSDREGRERGWRELIKLEKLSEGILSDSEAFNGVVLQKEPTSAFMPSLLVEARVLVLEGDLEYAKAQSVTELEMASKDDLERLLDLEERFVEELCGKIRDSGANLVFVKGGAAPVSEHFLAQHGIALFRRLTAPQIKRLALSTGARVASVGELEGLDAAGIGGLLGRARRYELRRINDVSYSFVEGDEAGRSVSIILRGAGAVTMKEVEANVEDVIGVLYSLWGDSRVVVGGGGFEAALEGIVREEAGGIDCEKEREVVRMVAESLLVIPRILAENCGEVGLDKIREIRQRNGEAGRYAFGINGTSGDVMDNMEEGVYDCFSVKESMLKTAVNSTVMLMRIGDVLSGLSSKEEK